MLLLCYAFLWLHPFYVSILDINYNAPEKNLEISVRVFTDDFEKTLQINFPGQKFDLFSTTQNAKTDSLINRYIKNKLSLKINGKHYDMKYLGHERVEESTWCYFEILPISAPKTIHISNTLLYEYHKEQTNLHNITIGNASKTLKLENPESVLTSSF